MFPRVHMYGNNSVTFMFTSSPVHSEGVCRNQSVDQSLASCGMETAIKLINMGLYSCSRSFYRQHGYGDVVVLWCFLGNFVLTRLLKSPA